MTEGQQQVSSIVRDELPLAGRRLLLAPGRARTAEDVLRASATSFESWSEVERADAECRDGLMPLFGTEQAGIVVVPGAASLGIEVAVVAASPPGAVVLVLGHGPQCDRITHVVSRRGRVADVMQAQEGGSVDLQLLRARLIETRPSAIVVSHVDADSGIVAPIDDYAAVAREVAPETLLVVDGTWATGCMPQRMDDWHADIVFTDSASTLGGCSGLVLAAVSSRLRERKVRDMTQPRHSTSNCPGGPHRPAPRCPRVSSLRCAPPWTVSTRRDCRRDLLGVTGLPGASVRRLRPMDSVSWRHPGTRPRH